MVVSTMLNLTQIYKVLNQLSKQLQVILPVVSALNKSVA